MRSALAPALLLLTAAPAAAELDWTPAPVDHSSPQRFLFELKFGPWSPHIDSTPGLKGTPFADVFGNGTGNQPGAVLLTTLELDWQFLRGSFGSLGLAGSVGFSRRTAQSFQYAGTNPATGAVIPCQDGACVRSGDETALNVFPLALELVFRFDLLARRYHVPLVPYAKGGIGYYLFWIQRGGGDVARALGNPDDSGIGGTFGLVAHPGMALLLDVFEPAAARTLDVEFGINHAYLFFELNYAWATGLGLSGKMVFSDITWNGGLAFEF